jgi:hypothetical protein
MWLTLILLFLLWLYLHTEAYFDDIESVSDIIEGVYLTFAELCEDVDSFARWAYAERVEVVGNNIDLLVCILGLCIYFNFDENNFWKSLARASTNSVSKCNKTSRKNRSRSLLPRPHRSHHMHHHNHRHRRYCSPVLHHHHRFHSRTSALRVSRSQRIATSPPTGCRSHHRIRSQPRQCCRSRKRLVNHRRQA